MRNVCNYCDANLDPSERCDCQIERRAKEKLNRIIKTEGDANGLRLHPSYFDGLVQQERASGDLYQYTLFNSLLANATSDK